MFIILTQVHKKVRNQNHKIGFKSNFRHFQNRRANPYFRITFHLACQIKLPAKCVGKFAHKSRDLADLPGTGARWTRFFWHP